VIAGVVVAVATEILRNVAVDDADTVVTVPVPAGVAQVILVPFEVKT
jgi:hypothetical protein